MLKNLFLFLFTFYATLSICMQDNHRRKLSLTGALAQTRKRSLRKARSPRRASRPIRRTRSLGKSYPHKRELVFVGDATPRLTRGTAHSLIGRNFRRPNGRHNRIEYYPQAFIVGHPHRRRNFRRTHGRLHRRTSSPLTFGKFIYPREAQSSRREEPFVGIELPCKTSSSEGSLRRSPRVENLSEQKDKEVTQLMYEYEIITDKIREWGAQTTIVAVVKTRCVCLKKILKTVRCILTCQCFCKKYKHSNSITDDDSTITSITSQTETTHSFASPKTDNSSFRSNDSLGSKISTDSIDSLDRDA